MYLEAVAEGGQRFANVIGQLLVEGPLQVGRAHALGHVAVVRVRQEKLALGRQRHLDVLASVDVLPKSNPIQSTTTRIILRFILQSFKP